MEIAPGAHHFHRWLTIERQRTLADECRALADGVVPAYVPIVRGGGSMHVRMLCLGRHWNAKTYRYESTRADFDGLPAPPLPPAFRALAQEIAAEARMTIHADLCILNYYDADGRMGLHQDKDEGRIAPGTAPPEPGLSGRFNLTFRQSDEACRALS